MMSETTTATAPRRRRWLRWSAVSMLMLLLIVIGGAGWLLGTASGLRFALARAHAATSGALSVQQARGRLAGPLILRGIHYNDGKGMRADIDSARMDLRLWPLLSKRVHVLDLDVEGVKVELPKSNDATPASSHDFSLRPPLSLLLDRVHVGRVEITRQGQPLFASNSLELAGAWTHSGMTLRQLALRAPDGHVDLDGLLIVGVDTLARGTHGSGKVGFAWKFGGTDYAGDIAAHSDGKSVRVELAMTLPTPVQLQLDLSQNDRYAWTAKLDAPRFDSKWLIDSSSLTALAIQLQGSGDRFGGQLTGQLGLNDYALQLRPLRARFNDDFSVLTLQQLGLGSPQIKGMLQASGSVQLAAKPVRGELAMQWRDLELPAELAGQTLQSHGSLVASGSADAFHVQGDIDLGPPGKLANLALNLDGTPQQIALHTLAVKQPKGGLQAQGTLTLQPALAWQLQATGNQFDPGQWMAGWNGSLNFGLATHGALPRGDGPDATLELRKFGGQLRQRSISGQGTLHLSPNKVVDGKLALASGNSTIGIAARPGTSNDAVVTFAIASLGDWLPNAGGRLDGQFAIRGLAPKLSVNGQLRGRTVVYAQQTFDSLQLIAGIPDLSHPAGKLELDTNGVNLAGLRFQHINLLAEGSQSDHQLSLNARGTQLSAALALRGALKGNNVWNGMVGTLDLEPQGLPRWRLRQPTPLSYTDGVMNLAELCLSAGDPLLCVAAKQDRAGNLDGNYRLQNLPLALLVSAAGSADLPMRADGTLQGSGAIHRNIAGALDGNLAITSARGSITYTDQPDHPLLSYTDLALNVALTPASQHATVRASLSHNGRLDGQIGISGAEQTLDGQLNMHLGDLGFVELFSSAVANVQGNLDGNFHFGGTLKQPTIGGQAQVKNFAAEVPAVGIKLKEGQLAVSTAEARIFRIDGTAHSGTGSVVIGGGARLGANVADDQGTTTAITLKGSQFMAADIPAAKVLISPDLVIRQDAKGNIDLDGSVGLDSADVDVSKLPGAGATKASSDVVIIDRSRADQSRPDQKQPEQAAASLPITARVKVDLGNKTHLIGMGMDGKLSGLLTVIERPGQATAGQGQINVDGIYKAYGQNLAIEQGRLLFASTPIDNPGLDIRASRKLNPNATVNDGQKVGLYVSGTARRPVLTVFSDPVMEQSDALSYLITGKPLSQVKGGEGNMVGAAAQALGSAAGDLLAKSIGTKIGVDDIGVTSNEALGGNSAFSVGKYLSPRLYLSYGVGLFDPGQVITLRYKINHRWNFEGQNATDYSRASLNYRIEK